MSRIAETFQTLQTKGQTGLIPFLTVGYPERDSALSLIPTIAEAGADLIELGVPFSDPLADGPTIQAASQQALANGITMARCLEQATTLRATGVTLPFVLMGYYNPIYQYGIERFAKDAVKAGIDGVIIPDLPPEESGALAGTFAASGLDLIFLLAPNASQERIELISAQANGFLYLVSLIGVTGARDQIADELQSFVRRVREATDKPLAVGFGISTPEHAAQVAQMADGVIVGSALIEALQDTDDPRGTAYEFISALRAGIDAARI